MSLCHANVRRTSGERLAKGWRKLALAKQNARHASGGDRTHDLRARLVMILAPMRYTTCSVCAIRPCASCGFTVADPTARRLDTPTPASTLLWVPLQCLPIATNRLCDCLRLSIPCGKLPLSIRPLPLAGTQQPYCAAVAWPPGCRVVCEQTHLPVYGSCKPVCTSHGLTSIPAFFQARLVHKAAGITRPSVFHCRLRVGTPWRPNHA